MRFRSFIFSFFLLIASVHISYAQVDSLQTDTKVYRIAIFAPLYLDSVFVDGTLKNEKTIPKFIMSAVDFMQGAQIAFDTLNIGNKKVDAYFFDSKSFKKPISTLILTHQLDSIDLIIGSVKEPEYSELATFAGQKNIPFISATYPNEGNVQQNPFVVIANSTLKAHCEGIYNYLVAQHSTDPIYLINKKNDNRIENYFKELNGVGGVTFLKIKTITVSDSISTSHLSKIEDTTKTMVIIGASLDEVFARKLANACYPIQKKYPLVLIGMPNWDGFKSLLKKNVYKDFPIRFTTPYYDARNNDFSNFLVKNYYRLYRSRPSDMAYKGFQSAYYFTSILMNYGPQFMSHLNMDSLAPFHIYNFKPVFAKDSGIPDYFENKHLFIMQILNGEIVKE